MEPGRFIIMFTSIHHWSKSEALNGKAMRCQYEGYTEQGCKLESCFLSRSGRTCILLILSWPMDTALAVFGGEGGLALMLTPHFQSSVEVWECSALPNRDYLYPYLKHRGLVLEGGCDLGLCAKLFSFYVLQAVKSFNLKSNIPHMHMHLCFNCERCLLFLRRLLY